MNASQAWAFIAGVFIISMPIISEVLELRKILSDKSSVSPSDFHSPPRPFSRYAAALMIFSNLCTFLRSTFLNYVDCIGFNKHPRSV